MAQSLVGVFLPGTLTRITGRIMLAKEAVNMLARKKMPASMVSELSAAANVELVTALETLELILGQLRDGEFQAIPVIQAVTLPAGG